MVELIEANTFIIYLFSNIFFLFFKRFLLERNNSDVSESISAISAISDIENKSTNF